MSYFKKIINNYGIRRTEKEKELFRQYVKDEFNNNVKIETLDKKHNNIIIGNIEEAEIVFTAHYDTPAKSIIPNIMMPLSKILIYIYHFGFFIFLAVISLIISKGISMLLTNQYIEWVIIYMILYFSSYFFLMRFFKNKNNYNDNTSGVATVLTLAHNNLDNNKIAYILFDNEEKGLEGSKAYNKHHSFMKEKLVINLDCVGNGEHIIIISKELAMKNKNYLVLKNNLIDNEKYQVHYFSNKEGRSNSDQKSFEQGVGIMVCKENKTLGYYTSRIHTNKDTIVSEENIEYLTEKLTNFINKL